MAPRLSTTERGYGHSHQVRREQLMYNHRDGTPCKYCGRPMYRDKERNFDGAPLNADHRERDKSRLAKRLLHDSCNKKMNGEGKWVEYGPGWYAMHGQPESGTGDLDWPDGKIIEWEKIAQPSRIET